MNICTSYTIKAYIQLTSKPVLKSKRCHRFVSIYMFSLVLISAEISYHFDTFENMIDKCKFALRTNTLGVITTFCDQTPILYMFWQSCNHPLCLSLKGIRWLCVVTLPCYASLMAITQATQPAHDKTTENPHCFNMEKMVMSQHDFVSMLNQCGFWSCTGWKVSHFYKLTNYSITTM